MIYIRLAGGLGNQLFQLAAGLEIQSVNNQPIVIYINGLKKYATKRDFSLLSVVRLLDNVVICEKETFAIKLLKYRVGRFNLPFCVNNDAIQKINRKQPFYFVDGYFQDIQYIKRGIDLLKILIEKSIQSNVNIKKMFLDIISEADIDDFCALHIRRGDYTNKKNLSVYPLLNKDYYLKGLEEIGSKIKSIVIFSDDKNIEFDFFENYRIIRISDFNLSDYQEFLLFVLFNNIIIANSTFSFWGAICNIGLQKNKIAPSNWIYEKNKNKFWKKNLEIEKFKLI